MNTNDVIIKAIDYNLRANSDFEFIAKLEELKLSDIECIEEMFTVKNIKPQLDYQIVDNIYVKISYWH